MPVSTLTFAPATEGQNLGVRMFELNGILLTEAIPQL